MNAIAVPVFGFQSQQVAVRVWAPPVVTYAAPVVTYAAPVVTDGTVIMPMVVRPRYARPWVVPAPVVAPVRRAVVRPWLLW
jgi:hypothetical protein